MEALGVEEGIILCCIFKKQGTGVWTGFIWLRMETTGGMLWQCNQHSDSVK
jgi:hypothetical protein